MSSVLSKRFLLFALVALFCSVQTFAKHPKPFFFNDDKAAVLQKVVDLQQLQSSYSKNPDGSFQRLVVMQHAVSFPETIAVNHAGQALIFKAKDQIRGEGVNAYFYFHTFNVSGDVAKVEFTYYHDQQSDTPKMEIGIVTLLKNGTSWTITQSSIESK